MAHDKILLRLLKRDFVKIAKLISTRTISSFDQIPKAPYIPIAKIGSLPFLIKAGGLTHLHEYTHNLHRKLGPIYTMHMNGTQLVFLSDAEANTKVSKLKLILVPLT